MLVFTGERFEEQETEAEEAGYLPNDLRDNNHKRAFAAASDATFHGGPNTKRLGEDQPCGGGRRVIRKKIGD